MHSRVVRQRRTDAHLASRTHPICVCIVAGENGKKKGVEKKRKHAGTGRANRSPPHRERTHAMVGSAIEVDPNEDEKEPTSTPSKILPLTHATTFPLARHPTPALPRPSFPSILPSSSLPKSDAAGRETTNRLPNPSPRAVLSLVPILVGITYRGRADPPMGVYVDDSDDRKA
ncbi:hypothetical protein NMY22_g5093 [Coprinellus aureogranulatus]|nr:hypothetical protein NMY22_g5093 [Coprinellus aureogranulatus]